MRAQSEESLFSVRGANTVRHHLKIELGLHNPSTETFLKRKRFLIHYLFAFVCSYVQRHVIQTHRQKIADIFQHFDSINMSLLRPYHSESSIAVGKQDQDGSASIPPVLVTAKSEPTMRRKIHPLLDDSDENQPHSYADLLLAAETFENIVMEGTLIGATIRSRLSILGRRISKESRQMNNRVLKLVYGTMKCMYFCNCIIDLS